MNLRRLAKYALTTGFAFGLIAGAGTLTAKAEKPTVNYNYETQELEVKPTSPDAAFYFYVVAESGGKTVSTERIEYKLTTSGVPDTTNVTKVDTSGLSYKKDVTLKIYSGTDWGTDDQDSGEAKIEIKAQPAKITAKFNPKEESLKQIEVTAGSTLDNGNSTTAAKWEYKTLYSNTWVNGNTLTKEKLDEYAVYGATLCIRQCSTSGTTSSGTTTFPTTGNIASKEVKLKIPKKANGPKAVVDPVKITVTIPAKCQWRVVGSDSLTAAVDTTTKRTDVWTAGWIKNETKKTYTSKELNDKIPASAQIASKKVSVLDGATIELQTEATAKKQESKISYVTLPTQENAPAINTDYTLEPVINTTKNIITGLKITNKTDKAMQVLVTEVSNVEPTATPAPTVKDTFDLTDARFTAVGAKQTKVLPVKTAANGNYLIIRYTGKKANAKLKTEMELSSKTSVEKIDYPVAATKDLTISLTTEGVSASGKTKVKVTNADTADVKVYYKVVNSMPKFVELNATKTSLGLDAEISSPSSGTDVAVSAGKYIIVYECKNKTGDPKDGVVLRYGCIEVKENDIKPTPVS